jgi:2-oxoglutarate ferredoxin oxidoreductase subunit gamma
MDLKRIILAGEGGQGVQTIAKLLVETAYKSGHQVAYLPNFGVEQRGGVSLAFVQISKREPIAFPKFKEADILIITAPRAIKRVGQYITADTLIVFDNSLITEKELSEYKNTKLAIPATYLAKEKLSPKVFNMVIFGAVLEEIGGFKEKIAKEIILELLREKIAKKPQLKNLNLRAYDIGSGTVKALKKGR